MSVFERVCECVCVHVNKRSYMFALYIESFVIESFVIESFVLNTNQHVIESFVLNTATDEQRTRAREK